MDQEEVQDMTENETPVQGVEESSTDEAQDEQAQEPESVEPEASEPEQDDKQQEQKKKPRNNAQSRIKQLLNENKEKQQQLEQYQMQQANNMPIPDELTPEQYRALMYNGQLAAAEIQQLRVEREYEKFTNALESVTNELPELNPDSDKYDPDLEQLIADNYEQGFIEKDAQGRFLRTRKDFKEFAKQQVKVYRNAQAKGTVATQAALDRQRSEQPVTSNSDNSSTAKSAEEMSIKELEKKLGQVRH